MDLISLLLLCWWKNVEEKEEKTGKEGNFSSVFVSFITRNIVKTRNFLRLSNLDVCDNVNLGIA